MIIIISVFAYMFLLVLGLWGYCIVNGRKKTICLVSYLPLCFGQYVHYRKGGFFQGGNKVNNMPHFWVLKEIFVIFPILGFINLFLTIIYFFYAIYLLAVHKWGRYAFGKIDVLSELSVSQNNRVLLRGSLISRLGYRESWGWM
jgi:hypothetical protein